MYEEDDFLQLSGIQHFAFCRRQWALIHVEKQWAENVHTVSGELMHEKVHDPFCNEKQKGVIIARAMPVRSRELGISGECDLVEFHRKEEGIQLRGHRGFFSIYPIEYKRGKEKSTDIDILQLVAQAMCLEEMFSTEVPEGALYYGESRRRVTVAISGVLREKVRSLFLEMHQDYQRGYTPKVKWQKGCTSCSLRDICVPRLGKISPVEKYLHEKLEEDSL